MSLDGLLRRETRVRSAVIMVLLLAGVWCAGALAMVMDAEAMGLGLAIFVAAGVALMWLIALGAERARKS